MKLDILIAVLAVAVCALWPQGVVLCIGGDGHWEVEREGADCCPSETGECSDCTDLTAPDRTRSAPTVELSPPLLAVQDTLPAEALPLDRVPVVESSPSPVDDGSAGDVLLI